MIVGHHVAELRSRGVHDNARCRLVEEGDLEVGACLARRREERAELAAHAFHGTAGLLAHENALAGGSRRAVELVLGVFGIVLGDHLGIRGESAGSEADGLRGHRPGGSVAPFSQKAGHAPVRILRELSDLGSIDDLAAKRAHSVDEEVLGVSAAAHIAAGGEIGSYAVGWVHAEAVEANAHAMQPVHKLSGIVVHRGLIGHRAIETVVLGHEVLAHDRQHACLAEHGVLVVPSDCVVRLQLRFRSRHARVGHRHRAARDVLLLEEDDRLAGFQETDGGDESCGAGPRKRNIHLDGLVGPAARLCGSQAEGRQVAAGVHDCIRDGVPDGDGSGRRARDDINVEIFCLEDSRRHHGGRRRADANGVVASQHAN